MSAPNGNSFIERFQRLVNKMEDYMDSSYTFLFAKFTLMMSIGCIVIIFLFQESSPQNP